MMLGEHDVTLGDRFITVAKALSWLALGIIAISAFIAVFGSLVAR